VRISDFVLFQKEGSEHFTGYANYFGLEKRACIVRKMGEKFVVLVEDKGVWRKVGMFYPCSGKVIGSREYELVGVIWTPEYTFHIIKDGNRFLGL